MSRLVIAAVLLAAAASATGTVTKHTLTECQGYSKSCGECIEGEPAEYDNCNDVGSGSGKLTCDDGMTKTLTYQAEGCPATPKPAEKVHNYIADGECVLNQDNPSVVKYVKVTKDATITVVINENDDCTGNPETTTLDPSKNDGNCHEDTTGSSSYKFTESGDDLTVSVYSKGGCNSEDLKLHGTFTPGDACVPVKQYSKTTCKKAGGGNPGGTAGGNTGAAKDKLTSCLGLLKSCEDCIDGPIVEYDKCNVMGEKSDKMTCDNGVSKYLTYSTKDCMGASEEETFDVEGECVYRGTSKSVKVKDNTVSIYNDDKCEDDSPAKTTLDESKGNDDCQTSTDTTGTTYYKYTKDGNDLKLSVYSGAGCAMETLTLRGTFTPGDACVPVRGYSKTTCKKAGGGSTGGTTGGNTGGTTGGNTDGNTGGSTTTNNSSDDGDGGIDGAAAASVLALAVALAAAAMTL